MAFLRWLAAKTGGNEAERLEHIELAKQERQVRHNGRFTRWLNDFVSTYQGSLQAANPGYIQQKVEYYSVSNELAVQRLVQAIFHVDDCIDVMRMIEKTKPIFDHFLHSDSGLFRVFLKTFEDTVCRRLWTSIDLHATQQLRSLTQGAGAFISEDSVVAWVKEVGTITTDTHIINHFQMLNDRGNRYKPVWLAATFTVEILRKFGDGESDLAVQLLAACLINDDE
jgi:hypothetical protein